MSTSRWNEVYFCMNNSLFLFFLQVGILLSVSLIFSKLAKRYKIPPIIGELFAGIVLGPSILKNICPKIYYSIFNFDSPISSELNCFTQLSMLFFMFFLGLEIQLKASLKKKKTIILTSLFSMIIPMLIGFGTVIISPNVFMVDMTNKNKIYFALFIGIALSISALPVILKILTDLKILNTNTGLIIASSAIINDLVGWSLFAGLITLITQKTLSVCSITLNVIKIIIFPFLLYLIIKVLKPIINKHIFGKKGISIGFIISIIVLVAAIAEKSDVHPFFAVFIIGVIFKNQFFKNQNNSINSSLNTLCADFLSPLYFATIGLKTDFFRNFDMSLVIVIIVVACLGKILGAILGAALGGVNWHEAMCIGVGLNARGAMEIIMASSALELNIISEKIYVSLLSMAIFTSVVSGLALKLILPINQSKEMSLLTKVTRTI